MTRKSALHSFALIPLLGLAVVLGCAETRPKLNSEKPKTYYTPAIGCETCVVTPARPPKNVLLVSSGGLFGAYAAGFLNGWTNTGTRPEFDVVTGVSTGSLIGLCSFLGPEYDQLAKQTYTMIQSSDIYTLRSWYSIPFASSIASNEPFKRRVESAVTDDVMNRVAAAHKAGRRLYVGTTNLETRRLVIWDMGSIACRNTPDARQLFINIIVASCAIPGMFPPVPLVICENGTERTEYHVDGATVAPLFVPPGIVSPEQSKAAGGMTVHCIIAGKYFVDPAPVKPRVLGVLRSVVPAITYAQCRSELASISHLSKLAGAGFVSTALPQNFEIRGDIVNVAAEDLNRMFLEGYRNGSAGPTWDPALPNESAADSAPRE